MSEYCFVLLEVVKSDHLAWYNYAYIVLYEVLVLMVLWCLIALIISDPGYVPKGYQYDLEALPPLDQALLRFLEANRGSYDASEQAFAGPNYETQSTIRESSMFTGWR